LIVSWIYPGISKLKKYVENIWSEQDGETNPFALIVIMTGYGDSRTTRLLGVRAAERNLLL